MNLLFLALTFVNLLCLCTASAVGLTTAYQDPLLRHIHGLAGVLAVLTCSAVHGVVFLYLVATSRWLKEAAKVGAIPPEMVRAGGVAGIGVFPVGVLGALAVALTGTLGLMSHLAALPLHWHYTSAMATIVLNGGVAVVEYLAIDGRGRLLREAGERVSRQRAVEQAHGLLESQA